MTSSMLTVSAVQSASPTHTGAAEGRVPHPTPTDGSRLDNFDKALDRTTKVLSSPEPGVWHVGIPDRRDVARVELDANWLTISVALRALRKPVSHKSIGAMLRQNARLRGCTRIVGQQLGQHRQLVADIPSDVLDQAGEDDIDAILASAFRCLGSALDGTADALALDTPETTPVALLEEALDQGGWPTLSTDGGGIEVPLEVPGDYAAARVEQDCGLTRLHLPVVEQELRSASRDSRHAVTLLLWLTASRVRMVKPLRRRQRLALDVALHPMSASAIALSHGCAALSIALQQFLGEARMLMADERLAQAYLSNLGLTEAT